MTHDLSLGPLVRARDDARPSRLRSLMEEDALAIAVVAIWSVLLAARLPAFFVPDSWLTFVDGRLIAHSGLPHVDTLTAWTLGKGWTDQQWGAHLAFYGVVRAGGTVAAGALALACVAAAVTTAVVLARRLGASPRSAAIGALVPLVGAPWMAEVRTQTLALAPFVLVYGLLALDARSPGRRVLLVLPLLAAWANLHGSVVLACGLTALYGLQRLRVSRGRATSLALVAGAALAPFASPYGFELGRYYRGMLLNPVLARVDSEWRPFALDRSTVAFAVTALAAAALLGRNRGAVTSFERWALPLLLVLAVSGVRHIVWFELAAAVSLPRLLDAAWPGVAPTASVRRVNFALVLLVVPITALLVAAQLAKPPARLEPAPVSAAAAVAAAAPPGRIVLADDARADWLLWHEPGLAGRIAYDVRFELFDRDELLGLVAVQRSSGAFWRRCVTRHGAAALIAQGAACSLRSST